MPAERALKVFAAILLLVCFALPLSQCTQHVDAQGNTLSIADRENWPADTRQVVSYIYPVAQGDWLLAVALAWPVIALAILQRRPRGRTAATIRVLELLLVAASLAYIDFAASFLRTRAIGAYWAYCALGLYAIGAIWSDVIVYRDWRGRRADGRSPANGGRHA